MRLKSLNRLKLCTHDHMICQKIETPVKINANSVRKYPPTLQLLLSHYFYCCSIRLLKLVEKMSELILVEHILAN